MKQSIRIMVFVVVVGILLITSQIDKTYSNSLNSKEYPIICKSELGPLPKNLSLIREVDVNSDGLTDLIVRYPSGGSALYINCGRGRYYRVMRSSCGIEVKAEKKGSWASINICNSGIIDGIVYRFAYIPMELESQDGSPAKFNIYIEHNGVSYKPPFPFSKKLGIYAPVYRFDQGVQVIEKTTEQDISAFYFELTPKITYRIKTGPPYKFWISGVYFTDLNHDGALDAIVNYNLRTGLSSGAYAGLFLNGGDNTFIAAAKMELGYVGMLFPRFKSQSIKVNGENYTAIVYKHPNDGKYEDNYRKDQYELFIYQSQLKQFIHIAAKKGRDKQSFIPLDQKKYTDTIKPPFLMSK